MVSSPSTSSRPKRKINPPSNYTPSSPNNSLGAPRYSSHSNRQASPSSSKSKSTKSSSSLIKGKANSKRKRVQEEQEQAEEDEEEMETVTKGKKRRKKSQPAEEPRRRSTRTSLKGGEYEEVEDEIQIEDHAEEGIDDDEEDVEMKDRTIGPARTPSKTTLDKGKGRAIDSPQVIIKPPTSSTRKSSRNPSTSNQKSSEKDEESKISSLISTTSSDLYFQSHQSSRSKKYVTSSNLISSSLGPLSSAALESVSATKSKSTEDDRIPLSPFHPSSLNSSLQLHSTKRFSTWNSLLLTGHSLLFYGIGDKSKILQSFLRERASEGEGNICLIRGNIPGIRIEGILDWIEKAATSLPEDEEEDESFYKASGLLGSSSIRSLALKMGLSSLEARALSITRFLEFKDDGLSFKPPALFLLFNDIDSPALTSRNARKVISILASSNRIRLLGTMDHWNAGLLVGTGGTTGISERINQQDGTSEQSQSFGQSLVPKPSFLHIHLSTYLPPATSIQLSRPGVRLAGLPRVLIPAGGCGPAVGITKKGLTGPSASSGPNHISKPGELLTVEAAKHTLAAIPERSVRLFRRIVEATFLQLRVERNQNQNQNQSQGSETSKPSTTTSNSLTALNQNKILDLARAEFIMQESSLADALREPLTHGLLTAVDGMEGNKATKLYQIQMGRKEVKELVGMVKSWPRWEYISERNVRMENEKR